MPFANLRRELALEQNIVVMGLTSMVATFGNMLWYFFLPYYFQSFGATAFQIGSVYAIWLAVIAVGAAPAGALADRFGRKNIIVLSSTISVVAVFMLAFSNGFLISAIAFSLVGLGTAFFQVSKTLVAESVEKERRGTAFGTFLTLEQVLAVFSPAIGGFLVSRTGYFVLFFIGGALTLSAVIPRLILLSETLPESERKFLSGSRISDYFSRFKVIANNRFLLTLVVVYSLYNLLVDQNSYIAPLYAKTVLRLNQPNTGLLFSALLAVLALSRLPAGKLADKIGRRETVILSWVGEVSVVYVFVFAPIGAISIALIGIVLWQFFGVLDAPAINAWIAESSDAKNRGLSMGVFYSVSFLATVPALVISGFLFGINPQLPFYLNSVLGVCALFLLIKYTKENP